MLRIMIMIDTNIKKVKRLLSFFCLLLGLSQPAFGTTGYAIRKIDVMGNVLVETDLLIALSGVRDGTVIDPSSQQIRTAISKIAKHDRIKSVEIYLSDLDQANGLATFVIHVEEYPEVVNCLIEGLTKKDRKALLEKVTIDDHVALSPLFIQKTISKIKKFFLEQGFRDVQVFTECLPTETMDAKVTLKIKINKGNKTTLHKIIFEGNDHLETNLLLYKIKELKEAPRFTLFHDIFKQTITMAPLRKGGLLLQLPKTLDDIKRYFFTHASFFSSVFTEEKYLKAKENLILFYQSKGFQDVHIAAERFETFADGKLNIYLKINEGKQYMIRDIKWVGNYVYSDQVLNRLLNLQPGRIYDPLYIKSRLHPGVTDLTIGDLYTNNGYLFFRAEVVETSIEDNQVDLEIRIQEGKQATINQIDIVGNTLTHDYVIRRTLLTLPGAKYNLGLVRESLRRLAMLKLFKPEKLVPDIQPDVAKGTVDIIYSVEEEPRFECNLNGGYTNGIKIGLGIGSNNVSLKNLFTGKVPLGAAQDLHLKAEISGKDYKNLSFSFTEPWFWLKESPYILSVSFNNAYQKVFYATPNALDDWVDLNLFPIAKQDKKSNVHSIGGQISLGKKFARDWSSNFGIAYHHHAYQHIQLLEDHTKRSGFLHDFTLALSLTHDSINHPNYPTSGCLWSNFLTLTLPYSLLGYVGSKPEAIPRLKEFGKLAIDFAYFKAFPASFVLHVRGHAGFLHSLSKKAIGPFERFYLGGTSGVSNKFLGTDFTSLRGYPDESLTPEDYKNHIKGGVLFNKLVIELRYPIMLAPVCCYVLGFGEVGDSWLKYENFNLSNMKKAIGAGIRVMLPIPIIPMIGLDFGRRLNTIKDMNSVKSSFEYHFTLGPTMR